MTTTHIGQELAIIVRSAIGHGNYRAAKDAGFALVNVLQDLDPITRGQACDLLIEHDTASGLFRVWLARTGLADGEPFENTIYLEEYDPERGAWGDLAYFDGDVLLSDLPTHGEMAT